VPTPINRSRPSSAWNFCPSMYAISFISVYFVGSGTRKAIWTKFWIFLRPSTDDGQIWYARVDITIYAYVLRSSISAESQHNFHILPHFNSKTTEPIFTIFSHDLELLVELLTRASARLQYISFQNMRAKSEDGQFRRWQKSPKINWLYHGNVPRTTAKLMAV